ncbi:MAG: ornithine cyclodeaminase family protein [Bacteroidota bacterium]
MKNITAEQIESLFSYQEFIPFLNNYLSKKIEVPQRNHFDIGNNTLLLMPAWTEQFCGVKIATAFPGNRKINKPTIHAVYTLFDAKTGEPLAQMDGKILTNKRTAAASALASQYLSKKESKNLLMVGNGALCPELIEAHASVRAIKNVKIWGRDLSNVKKVIAKNNWGKLNVNISKSLRLDAQWADIVSCATSAVDPVILGKNIISGTHIDLVGSYKPNMREADDVLIKKSKIIIDNAAAKKECGDIFIPLKNKIINESSIKGTLADLANRKINGRESNDEITLFKSVGFALEDLAAAEYFYGKLKIEN